MKLSIILPVIAALTLAACGNLSKVSKEGTTDNPVWPDAAKTTFRHDGTQHGTWPNWDNVRQIEAGMNKDQIYELIGRPHFQEGLKLVNTRFCLTKTKMPNHSSGCQKVAVLKSLLLK